MTGRDAQAALASALGPELMALGGSPRLPELACPHQRWRGQRAGRPLTLQGHPGAAVHRATVLKGSQGTDLRSLGGHPASPVTGPLCGLSVPQQVRGHFLGDLPLSPWDSLVEDGEVESPAQAADDPVVGHAHGEVVVVVLGEGDGVRTRVGAGVLQEELQGDVELALAVLHDGQVRQV